MTARICVAVVLSSACCSHAQSPQSDLEALATKLFVTPPDVRQGMIWRLSAETRAKVLPIVAERARSAYNPAQFDSILVQLGDEVTIQRLSTTMVEAAGNDRSWLWAVGVLETALNPRVIAAMAPALFVEDPEALRIGLPSSRADEAATAVLRMIPQTPGFSDEMRLWGTEARSSSYFVIPILREWWKANRVHFDKGHYLAVQPGGHPPPQGSYEPFKDATGVWKMRMRSDAADWSPLPKRLLATAEAQAASQAAPPTEIPATIRLATEQKRWWLFVEVAMMFATLSGIYWFRSGRER